MYIDDNVLLKPVLAKESHCFLVSFSSCFGLDADAIDVLDEHDALGQVPREQLLEHSVINNTQQFRARRVKVEAEHGCGRNGQRATL